MIRILTFATGLLVSASAFANPALIGNWADACTSTGNPNQYVQTVTEFRADGVLTQTMTGYTDAACTAAVESQSQSATYTATATQIRALANISGQQYDLTMAYTIAGEILTVTPTALTIDGAPQNVSGARPTQLKRK